MVDMTKGTLLEKEIEKNKKAVANALEALKSAEAESHSAQTQDELIAEKEKHAILVQKLQELKNDYLQCKSSRKNESQSELVKCKLQVNFPAYYIG